MTLQINDYRMQGDDLVRITEMDDGRYIIQRVTTVGDELVVVGVDDSRSWAESDLSPITDPKMVALAKCFDANRLYEEMDAALDDAWAEVLKWNGVLQCIHEAEVAA